MGLREIVNPGASQNRAPIPVDGRLNQTHAALQVLPDAL
jgi:hypothetical protein